MEEASQVRRAARGAVGDIAPEPFREAVERVLADGSVAPGVLAVLCARATDREVEFAVLAERAAGTQLIYEGLGLTRDLAHDPPWECEATTAEDDSRADPTSESETTTHRPTSVPETTEAANVAVLVADVLVARGFYLLARTEAAGRAVETVRTFGREQTRTNSETARTGSLEADVFELAAVAGTTAVDESPPAALCAFVADRANEIEHEGELPPAESLFGPPTVERLGALAAPVADGGSTDGNRNG